MSHSDKVSPGSQLVKKFPLDPLGRLSVVEPISWSSQTFPGFKIVCKRSNRNPMSMDTLKGRRYNFLENAGNEFFAILARHARILSFCEGTVDYCQIIREQKRSSAGATRRTPLSLFFLALFYVRRMIPILRYRSTQRNVRCPTASTFLRIYVVYFPPFLKSLSRLVAPFGLANATGLFNIFPKPFIQGTTFQERTNFATCRDSFANSFLSILTCKVLR